MTSNELETDARCQIVELAKKNKLYFVIWDGHFMRRCVALQNASKNPKLPNIYSAIYESYYDLIGNDIEKFSFHIPHEFTWQELLTLIKTYLPIKYSIYQKIEKD